MPRIVRSRCEGARGKCCSRTRPRPPRPIAMVRKSATIAYPTLGIPTRQRADESGQHGGADPNFLTYSARTSTMPVCSSAFALVTGLRPKAVMTDSGTAIWIPPRGT